MVEGPFNPSAFDPGARPDENMPADRGVLDYGRDLAIDTARGVGKMVGAVPAIVSDVLPTNSEGRPAAQEQQEKFRAFDRWAGSYKSEKGRFKERTGREDAGLPQRAAEAFVTSVPALAASVATGPIGAAAIFGGQAYGENRNESESKIYGATEEQLADNPKYVELREQGKSDADARLQLYRDSLDPLGAITTTAGSALGGYGLGRIAGKAAMRTQVDQIVDRITRRVPISAAEGGAGMGAMAGSGEYGRQRADLASGFRNEMDPKAVWEKSLEGAEIGGLTGAVLGVPRRGPKKAVDKEADKGVAPIGATELAVAADQINPQLPPEPPGDLPTQPGGRPIRGDPQRIDDPYGGGPGGPHMPSEPSDRPPYMPPEPPTEQAAAPVTPAAPVAPRSPRPSRSPRPPRDDGTAALPGGEPMRGPQERIDDPYGGGPGGAHMPSEPSDLPPYMPTEQPVTRAPAGAPAYSREELFRRAVDPTLSPDHASVMKHIADWQAANPGEKLGVDRNTLLQASKQARGTAAKAAKTAKPVEPEVTPASKPVEASPEEKAAQAASDARTAELEKQSQEETAKANQAAAEQARAKIAEAEAKPEPEPKTEPEAKPAPLAKTGPEAEAAIAKTAQERVNRRGKAADEQAKGAVAEEKRAVNAEARATQREDEHTTREIAARDIRSEHTPGANMQAESARVKDALRAAHGAGIFDLLKPTVERARQILSDYAAKMKELAGKTTDHMVYRQFDPGARARVGARAGPYHSYMTRLHNFVRDAEHAIRNHKYEHARHLGIEHLESEDKMLAPKGAEEILAGVRKASQDVTAVKKSTSTEAGSETRRQAIQKEVAESSQRDKLSPEQLVQQKQEEGLLKPKVSKGTARVVGRDKHGRLRFEYETGEKENWVGGVQEEPDPYRQSNMRQEAENRSRDLGRRLSVGEFIAIARKHGDKVATGKFSDILGEARPPLHMPIHRAIFDAMHALVKDIPVTVWSRDAMEVFNDHHGGERARAMYSYGGDGAVFRRDALVSRTIFHEALHAATARALDGSRRLTHLVNRLQDIIESRYRDNIDVTSEPAFQTAIRKANGERVNAKEFVSELFTRPEIEELVRDVRLTPAEVAELTKAGWRVDAGKTLLGTLWDNFLKTIGYRAKTPSAQKVAVDFLQDMFAREGQFQARDQASGNPLGVVFTRQEINNLAQRDPVLGERIAKAVEKGDHRGVVNELMDLAGRIAERGDETSADLAIKYLKKLNEQVYDQPDYMNDPVTPVSNPAGLREEALNFLDSKLGETGKKIAFWASQPDAKARSVLGYGLSWTHHLAEVGEQGFRDVMRKSVDLIARHGAFAERYMRQGGEHSSEPAAKFLADMAELKHSIKDRTLWNDFEKFLIRESAHQAYADEPLHEGRNKHIHKDRLIDEQTRQEHAELQAEWKRISDRSPELAAMRDRAHAYGRAEQNARSRKLISDMAVLLEMVEPGNKTGREAIVKRVLDEQSSWTQSEKFTIDQLAHHPDFEENINDLKRSRELAMVPGPYTPFERRGQHTVLSKFKVAPDAGVDFKPIEDAPRDGVHEGYDFANPQDAKNFIRDKLNPNGITQLGGHEVVIDKATGKQAKRFTDAEYAKANGEAEAAWEALKKSREEKGDFTTRDFVPIKNSPITPKEFKESEGGYSHAELRHRVTFNPRDYRMFESLRQAHEHKASMDASDKSGLTITTDVERAPDHMSRANSQLTSANFQKLINRVEAKKSYQSLTEAEQARMKRDWLLESMRIQTTSARRSRFLPRTYAQGASTDMLRNYMEMATSQSHSMADLTYRSEIAEALENVRKYNQDFRYSNGAGERDLAFKELLQRAYAPAQPHSFASELIGKALRVSQVSHLADLGYLMTNATDNWINALPVVGGRHGYYASAKELLRSSKLFEPGRMAKAAFGDMGRAARRKQQTVNYEELALDMIKNEPDAAALGKNFRNVFEKGLISPDAGMEIERMRNLEANAVGRSFERVDGVLRAAAAGVETHNRLSLATSAYRLEFAKTHDEAAAIAYAETMLRKGAGDYGAWNRPRLVNHPWLKLGMQFKQFPMRIIANYGEAIMGTARGEPEKMKQLAFMLATQSIASGVLGLPLGPASGAVNAGYMLGLWDHNWEDVTASARKWVAKYSTPEIGEVLFHGLPRVLGIDTSKLGQGSLWFFGSPDGQKPIDNLKSGLWMLAGAPGDMVKKYGDGIQQAIEAVADFRAGAHEQARIKGIEAAENLIQVKAFTDIGRAYIQSTGGPGTKTRGGVPLGNEYTTYQAVLRAIGITPAAEAEASEMRSTIKRDVKREEHAHTATMQMFIKANDKELSSIWRDVHDNYNPGRPRERQISFGDLLKARAQAQRQAQRDTSHVGAVVSRKKQSFVADNSYYNTRQ